MVFLFSCYSFMFWLVDFQQEYLGTDMFVLFYANGVVCIVSGFFNLWLYPLLGMKVLILWTNSIGLVSTFFLILTQQKIIALENAEEEEVFIAVLVPILIFFLALNIQIGFTAIFQSAFEDDRIFPFRVRATSCNIIIMVSKTITIAAPFVNEIEEPIPLIVVLCI